MIDEALAWCHLIIFKHDQKRTRVTIPMMDPSKGILVECSCGQIFAL